jgi:ATP-dependent Clp protease ATP-binding subunit ClpA
MHMPDTISYPFTSRTYVALSIARGIAAGCGHADITPAHIALGILREGENAAVAALQFAGVGIPKLRHDLETELPPRGRTRFGEVVLPATPGEQEIVELAVTEAAELNDPFLANEHLLLAMLRDPGTPVARIFSQYGFTYAAAMTQLQSVRTGS